MHEEGNFTYYTRKGNDGVTYVHISELTKLGKQQRILVIPEEIDGIKVCALEKWGLWATVLEWESENLEKVFFSTIELYIDSSTFKKCLNLNKLILTVYDGDYTNSNFFGYTTRKRYLYVSKKAFEIYILLFATSTEMSEEDAYDRIYGSYNIRPANISYYYNYDTNINYGYYWVDDVDYGGLIEYIPQDPVREGYEFGGWYKEAECINRWSFETDSLPEGQVDEEGNTVYQETILYANWIAK